MDVDGSSPPLEGRATRTDTAGERGSVCEPDDGRTAGPTTVHSAAELVGGWKMKKLKAEIRRIEMKILADPKIQVRLLTELTLP